MIEILRTTAPEDDCPYLKDRDWRMEYRGLIRIRPDEYERLLARGWRRNGQMFFRPRCDGCSECRSMRLDVEAFRPSKSQRRALRRNADVDVTIQSPTVTDDHIRLFNAYHEDMTERRNWPLSHIDAEGYSRGFLDGNFEFAREFVYRRAGRVIGIGLVDVVPTGTSSVYFFHDPSWREDGPGTYSILQEIEFARQTLRPHVYLGYYVADCPSMSYKARFGPHKILQSFVEDNDMPTWE